MRNFLKIALLSTTLISSIAGAAEEKATEVKTAPSKLTDSSVVAEFNGTKVVLKDVLGQYKDVFENQPGMKGRKFEELDKSIQENIIKGYVHSKLIEQEAKATKIEDTAEYKEKLEQVKVQLAQQMFIEKKLKEKVTDSAIAAEYEKVKKELSGKEELKASHILVAKEETAKEVKAKLEKGAKFEDLAKQYSSDEGSKANGGELGYFGKGQLVPEFENKAFAMKKGEISTPVKTQFGWHIIRLDDRRAVKVPTLEEAKSTIQNKLNKDAIEKYIEDLDKKATVKIIL